MDYAQFEKQVKKKIENFYIFYGKENFLKEEGISLIKEILGENTFFLEQTVDNNFNIPDLVANLGSDSLFSDTSLVIIKSADSLITRLAEPLQSYYDSPNNNSILILEMEKLDNRSKFAKFAKDYAQIIECNSFYDRPKPWLRLPPWESDLAKWVCSHTKKKYHKEISPQTAFLLTEYVGNNLQSLDSQLEKISLFIQQQKQITAENIESLVYQSKKISVFDLLDAVSEKKLDVSLTMCRQIFKNGIENRDGGATNDDMQIALQIVRLFHLRFKQIWQVAIQKDGGNITEFARKKIAGYAPHFDKEELIHIWQNILEVEYTLKSSRALPLPLIEQSIIEIIYSRQKSIQRRSHGVFSR